MFVEPGMAQPTSFRYEEADAIATITLDRPDKLNALTFTLYSELRDLFAALATRHDIRALSSPVPAGASAPEAMSRRSSGR